MTSWWRGSTWRTQSSVSKKKAKCISQLGSHPRYSVQTDDQIFTNLVIAESLSHVLSKILAQSARTSTRNSVSGIEEKSGWHQHQSGGHVELRHPFVGVVHQGDPIQWPHTHGDRDEDRDGGNEAGHQSRYFPPHGKTDQDLYEWRPRQTTNIWSDHTNSGENEKIIIATGLSFSQLNSGSWNCCAFSLQQSESFH